MTGEPTDDVLRPRRLTRTQDRRLIAGVCSGLSRHTRIDPVVFRVGFALLAITSGIGVLLYVASALLMAGPDGAPAPLERAFRRLFDGDTVLAVLGAFLGAGAVFGVFGAWGARDALTSFVVVALALFVARSRGVDLVNLARGMPDQLRGRPLSSWTPTASPPPPPFPMSEGMIDLAHLGGSGSSSQPPPAPKAGGPFPNTRPTGAPYADGPNPGTPHASTPPADMPYAGTPHATSPSAFTAGPYTAGATMPLPRRPRSHLSSLTLLAAMIVAAALYASVGERPELGRLQVALAGALAVVAAGLLLGAWFGRDRTLITIGVIMSLALASTPIAGNPAAARSAHHLTWRPTGVAQAEQSHKVVIGEGTVDLTTVPLSPGQRLNVSAQVSVGRLAVRVPATTRVEVDGHALIGDITVDHRVTAGPSARVLRVLEPETAPKGPPPTIALRIRSKVGDLEILRVPA